MKSARPKSAEPARKGSSVARKTAVATRSASKPAAQRSQPAPPPTPLPPPPVVAQPAPVQPPLAPGVPIMPFPRPTILGLGSPWRTAGRPPGMPPRPSPPPHPPAAQPRPAAVPVVTMKFPMSAVDKLIKEALAEDVGDGDLTSESLFPGKVKARGKLIANEEGVLAGLPIFKRVFELVDKNITFEPRATDGMALAGGQLVARISGPAVSVLRAERTALNFLQLLSGIASQTAKFANAVKGTKTRILDTRRTTPGLRFLEKYAVEVGGGVSVQKGLADRLVVTESHLALSEGVPNIVRQLRKAHPGKRIELTVTNMQELDQALMSKVNVLLLENFPPGQVRQAIALVQGRAKVEITGKVGLDNARAYALAGVDYISVSQLTQSVKAFDFSFRVTR
ncbi:MAG: carboxylating nicotinate-nucleotide diphosphorylase [Chloroflexi bacterium]|nr:MAG: carboxylating nicotinate-nucleotide diphosphorylase [Chloroflexota bacterium]TMG43125.1 MAG: carboxylating nicotinate-nucleotide diphosphorylase [Chloroflexota bacterium]